MLMELDAASIVGQRVCQSLDCTGAHAFVSPQCRGRSVQGQIADGMGRIQSARVGCASSVQHANQAAQDPLALLASLELIVVQHL